jgi:signal transduction histidine kinase
MQEQQPAPTPGLAGLLDAVAAIGSDLSLAGMLERIIEVACSVSGAQYGALGVLGTTDERRLREFVTFGMSPERRAAIGALPRGHGLLGLIIDRPEPLRLDRIAAHDLSSGFPPNHPPMNSFLGVPIRTRGKVFGNLYLTEKAGGARFTADDEAVVVALAAAAGVAIENARLFEQTNRRQRWLEAAAEITTALLGPVTLNGALQLIADRAREVGGASAAAVLLADPGGHGLVAEVLSGVDELAVGTLVPIPVADTHAVQHALDVIPGWPVGRTIAVPLQTREDTHGMLVISWSVEAEQARGAVDLNLPTAFAKQAALALQVTQSQLDRAQLAVFEDRDRIGRDLHDLVIQRLFAVGLTLQNASRLAEKPEVARRITTAVDDIDTTIKDIRRTIFDISVAPTSTDLRAEIRSSIDLVVPALGFQPTLRTEGPVDSAVPDDARDDLLAVLLEALSNVARHAEASSAEVTLVVGDEVVLSVSDDGRGVPAGAHESGLRNMRERATTLGGSCRVDPRPGGGTLVEWRVPVK